MATRAENVAVSVILIVASVGITQFLAVRYFVGAGDSASMIDLVKVVAAGHGLTRSSFNSANDLWALIAANADAYCNLDFVPRFRDASVLTWHPYWIAYLIAALTLTPGVAAATAVMVLVAVSHVGVLGLLWWFLRRHGVPLAIAILFIVGVFVFKPWSESILGQLYFDRLFILPGTALILLVHLQLTEKFRALACIAALALFCALLSERPALMIGVFLIGYPILRQGWKVVRSRDSLLLLAMGVICLTYVFIYVKLVQQSPYLSNWTSLSGLIGGLQSSLIPGGSLYPQTMKLFAVLAPFILLALFDWRLALIALGSVVPNLMVSVGGAEKYVFVTHYHMPYLPFLLAAAAVGLARLWKLVGASEENGTRALLMAPAAIAITIVLAAVAAYSNWINHTDLSRTFVFNNPVDPVLPRAVIPGLPNPWNEGARTMRAFSRNFVADIPAGSAVSAPEWLWPALVDRGGLSIDFMPFGIGTDPYVMLTYARMPGDNFQLQVTPFHSVSDSVKIRACVQARVDQNYRLLKQAEYGGIRFTIYERK